MRTSFATALFLLHATSLVFANPLFLASPLFFLLACRPFCWSGLAITVAFLLFLSLLLLLLL